MALKPSWFSFAIKQLAIKPAAPVTTIMDFLKQREVKEIRQGLTFLLLLCHVILAGCYSKKQNKTNGRLIRDKLGNEAILRQDTMRVMGLSPAITEMLFALLPDSCIAAVTPHCNFPPNKVKGKRIVSVMPLDFESILQIRPSLVLTEEGITSEADLQRMKELSIPVLMFSYRNLRDITDAMDSIRVWTEAGMQAKMVCDSLRNQIRDFENNAALKPAKDRKSILALTWTDPIFAYGAETWMSEKIRLAGGKNALRQRLNKPYPQLSREQVLALNPDVLFGGNFDNMDSSFFRLYPELKRIKAYKSRRIFSLNDDLASRPGPRFAEGIREIEAFINR